MQHILMTVNIALRRCRVRLNVLDVVILIVPGRSRGCHRDMTRIGAGLAQRDRPRHAAGIGVNGHPRIHVPL